MEHAGVVRVGHGLVGAAALVAVVALGAGCSSNSHAANTSTATGGGGASTTTGASSPTVSAQITAAGGPQAAGACVLTTAQASAILGVPAVATAIPASGAPGQECYFGSQDNKAATITVQLRSASEAAYTDFVKASPGSVTTVSGLGAPALDASGTLYVWKAGRGAGITVTGQTPANQLPVEEKVADDILADL